MAKNKGKKQKAAPTDFPAVTADRFESSKIQGEDGYSKKKRGPTV